VAWRLYQRRDLTRASYHHATSEGEAQNLRKLRLDVPVCTIPNGVDVPDLATFARAKTTSGNTALYLGRLHSIKGLTNLIQAWACVQPQNWCLKIAGPDQSGEQARLEKAVAAAGLSKVVSFLGPVDGQPKQRAFLEANLFILPSISESFGMAIGEALAHALPVLTTTGVPWPKLVENNCGWQVEPTVAGLVEGLRAATSCDFKTLQAMGMNGRSFVATQFRWDRLAHQFVSLYEQIITIHALGN
jgi:glycosyltransferase involved in cell wall biosynthesis